MHQHSFKWSAKTQLHHFHLQQASIPLLSMHHGFVAPQTKQTYESSKRCYTSRGFLDLFISRYTNTAKQRPHSGNVCLDPNKHGHFFVFVSWCFEFPCLGSSPRENHSPLGEGGSENQDWRMLKIIESNNTIDQRRVDVSACISSNFS